MFSNTIGRGRALTQNTPKVQPGFTVQPRKILCETSASSSADTLSPSPPPPTRDVPLHVTKPNTRYHYRQNQPNDLEEFFCNMLPRHYNRYGLTGVDKGNKIRARSPPPHQDDISLQDIVTSASLNSAINFTDFEKEIYAILNKCVSINRFDIIPAKLFIDWFNMVETDYMDAKTAQITTGEGPHKFYLLWRHSVFILTIIQNWLQYLNEEEKIDQFYSEDLEAMKGAWVAALADDNKWYRAKVVEVYAGNSVSLMYPDLGDKTHAVYLDRLRHLPGNLWNHKSLCFRVRLAGISDNDSDWDSNASINDGFITQLKKLDFVNAEIVHENVEKDEKEVILREIGNGKEKSINDKVHLSIEEWKKDIRYGLTPEDIRQVTVKEPPVNYHTSRLWQIIKVFSPGSFTLRVVNEENKWPAMNGAMQGFYNGLEEGRLRIRQGRMEPGQCYVYHCPKTSLWHRIEIVFADNEKKTSQVYLLDSGIYQMTVFDNMRKLTARFCLQPSQAFKCHLAHVTPIAKCWSEEAMQEFRNMAPEETIFVGVVVTNIKTEAKVGDRLNLSMVLIENRTESQNIGTSIMAQDSLQHKLCQKGFAKPSGIASGGWSTLQNIVKFKMESPQPSPEFMSESSSLMWKRTYDYYEKWDPKAKVQCKFVPREIRKHLCWIKIVRAESPSCIFIQLQEQIPSLMLLMHELSKCMNKEPHLKEEDIKPGMFVATFSRVTGKEDDQHWYRAVVLKKMPHQKIRMIIIDLGIEFTAFFGDIKKLPKQFLKEPSYAYRVHLDYPNLVPKCSREYSKECCQYLRRYVKGWNGACPIYYAWKHENSEIVAVDDIKQPLEFNFEDEKWEKSDVEIEPILKQVKGHSVMSHLFVSNGIIIEYENFNALEEPYTFSLFHHILIDNQFATL